MTTDVIETIKTLSFKDYVRKLIIDEEFIKSIEILSTNMVASESVLAMGLTTRHMDVYQKIQDIHIGIQADQIAIDEIPRDIDLVEMLTLLCLNSNKVHGELNEETIKACMSHTWVLVYGFLDNEIEIEFYPGDDITTWWQKIITQDRKLELPEFFEYMCHDDAGEVYVFKDGKQVAINVGILIWSGDVTPEVAKGEQQ